MSAGTETLLSTDNSYAANGTPRTRFVREDLTPEHTIPSSPILKDDESTPSHLRIPHTASDRTSRTSSIRLSRDLGSLRWDGDEGDFNEDDSIFEADEESGAGSYKTEATHMKDPYNGNESGRHAGTEELNSYSALSKRADFILASAKRKLNLLEGDLKGARHSLSTPSYSPQSPQSLDFSYRSPLRSSASTASAQEDKRNSVGPKINFGAPRHLRSSSAEQNNRGHGRNFSDTSVPSPRGTAVKGSLGLEYVRNQHPLRNKTSVDRTLVPVIEGEVATNYDEEDMDDTSGEESNKANRSSTTKVLRDEADNVRDRLAKIQERLRSDAEKRRTSRDTAIVNQIQALEISLEQQEQVIDQLERAEGNEPAVERDPRAEWQQILDRSDSQDDGYDSSQEYEDEAEFQSVLEVQDLEEPELNLDGAHEDRADAFDYEHFILHSVLGTYNTIGADRRSSTGSATSTSTTRGEEYDPAGASSRRHPPLHHNESIASFATAQSNVEDDDGTASDSSEPGRERHEDEADRSFPLPPSVNGSRQVSTVFSRSSNPTPTAESFGEAEQANGLDEHRGRRPASKIFAAIMGPESGASGWPDLAEEDQTVIHALAEALRSACLQLRRDTIDGQGSVDWQQRFEEARKVLTGERDI